MRIQILALFALTLLPAIASAETLGGVWHVTKTESAGKPTDFLSISESTNGGPVAAVHHLDAIEFTNTSMTFVVGGHRLNASTSLRLRRERGAFKIKLLGEYRDAQWKIDDEGLVLEIRGLNEKPIFIAATRELPKRVGRSEW